MMAAYDVPKLNFPIPLSEHEIALVANGDLRETANRDCWPAQKQMEDSICLAFQSEGFNIRRSHPFDHKSGHGFISSQRMGMNVFQGVHPKARLIVAEAVWQYSHHILAGLSKHKGPILTVANWSGQWPGLVGLLNLNASLTKMGIPYSTIWSVDFHDEFFLNGIRQWLNKYVILHDETHVRDLNLKKLPRDEVELGETLAKQIYHEQAILGVFDEGCMGMVNAILEDHLINPMGVYKERLSQSALVAAMRNVSDKDARKVLTWLERRGVTFVTGPEPTTDLTEEQLHEQAKMYIAAVRMAHEYGCDAIGIQYQQGLKDMTPASDLAEGLLNNPDRPPVNHQETEEELFAGRAVPHFNEADEGAGLDLLATNRVWRAMGLDPSSTLHDIRWGEHYQDEEIDDFVWVFQISGAAPASHFVGGYGGAISERQPPMFFPLGGGTLKGVCRPGEIVWSRIFILDQGLHADLGRATVVELPQDETERRWQATTPQWPIMHTVFHGISRDQMMARHKSNHIQVAYAPTNEIADRALAVKAAMFKAMGMKVHLCGEVKVG